MVTKGPVKVDIGAVNLKHPFIMREICTEALLRIAMGAGFPKRSPTAFEKPAPDLEFGVVFFLYTAMQGCYYHSA